MGKGRDSAMGHEGLDYTPTTVRLTVEHDVGIGSFAKYPLVQNSWGTPVIMLIFVTSSNSISVHTMPPVAS